MADGGQQNLDELEALFSALTALDTQAPAASVAAPANGGAAPKAAPPSLQPPPDRKNGAELLTYVLQVSHRMAAMRSLDPLLVYTIDEVLQFIGAECGYIVLVTDAGTLDFKVQRDRDGNDLDMGSDAISRSILADVVSSGRPLVLSNAMTDPRYGRAYSVMHLQLRSVMCVPLITQSRPIGAIYVENRAIRDRFRDSDLAPLELFANQAAVAIENAALNDTLAQAYQQLHELDQLKSNFVMLVSHELRTPLTAVNAYASLMKLVLQDINGATEPRVLDTHAKLESAVERLNKTIQEIIHVFRILSGQNEVKPTLLPIRSTVDRLVHKLRPVCDERHITLQVSGVAELPALMIDDKEMQVALENILGNAVKYTPDGGQIAITGRLLVNGVSLEIADTGIGIPAEEQGRVFDLFHVLGSLMNHSTAKHSFRGGGLGLGLPIARGIIIAHQGKVSVSSPGYDPEACPGTTCRLFLPLPEA